MRVIGAMLTALPIQIIGAELGWPIWAWFLAGWSAALGVLFLTSSVFRSDSREDG